MNRPFTLEEKEKIKLWMQSRVNFRLHMALILSATFLAGILIYGLISALEIELGLRLFVTISLCYPLFIWVLKIYIHRMLINDDLVMIIYYGNLPEEKKVKRQRSFLEVISPMYNYSGLNPIKKIKENIHGTFVLFVLVAHIVVAALASCSGLYLIWVAPEFLSECLSEVLISTGNSGKLTKLRTGQWLNPVLRQTIWPFILISISAPFLVPFLINLVRH